MRKLLVCILPGFILLILIFFHVGEDPPKFYTVERDGRILTVDTENSTITWGIDTYNYDLTKYGVPYELHISYPNGSSYWWIQRENSGEGGWSDDYDSGVYVSGELLRWALETGFPVDRLAKIAPCFLLFMFAIANILVPIGMWACYFGMYREGEPPEIELWGIRILGIFIILVTAAWFCDFF